MDSSDSPKSQADQIGPIDNTSPDVPLGAGLDLADPNSPLAPYYLRLSHLVALALLILFVFYAGILPTGGSGIWAQLAVGRYIVENGQMPADEPLSTFSDPDVPLPASGWLGRATLYLAYRTGANLAGGNAISRLQGGVEMLRASHTLLTAGFGLLALIAYARRSGSLALGCLGLSLLILAAPVLVGSLRSDLLGLLCFLALLALAAKDDLSWRAVALIPPLLALWANLDISFVGGLLLLALLLLGQLIESPRDRRTLRLLTALAGAVLFAGLLTPDGPALYQRLWAWSSRPPLADMAFWQPLNFSEWRVVHLVFLACLVALTLASAFSGRAYSPTEMAVLLGFCVLALWKQGTVGLWFLVVPWLLLPQLAALGERLSWQSVPIAPCLRKTFVGGILGLTLVLLILPLGLIRGKPRSLTTSVIPDVPWPVAAQLLSRPDSSTTLLPTLAAALRDSYPGGEFSGAIFGSETAGDFFQFMLPGQPVFLYSEPALFPERRWQEYLAIRAVRADWWELLDRERVNLIVFNPVVDTKLAEALEEDPAWLLLRGEGKRPLPWMVALRKKPIPPSPGRID